MKVTTAYASVKFGWDKKTSIHHVFEDSNGRKYIRICYTFRPLDELKKCASVYIVNL